VRIYGVKKEYERWMKKAADEDINAKLRNMER